VVELSDIVGQEVAVERLSRGLTGGRRPHAYLFVGPQGVGRRTTALAFARALLCAEPISANSIRQACGQCPDCTMHAAETHPDFHLIYKELARYHDDSGVRARLMQDLGIDVIRSFLIGPSTRAPARGRGRTFVVLEAELMSIPAQNALLKTLEEPPKGVSLILICRRAEQMLPTTRSRCSLIRFGALPREFVTERLCDDGIEAAEAAFWATYTGGSIGRAMQLARQGFYEVKRDVLSRLAAMGPAGDAELGEYLAAVTDKLATSAIAEAKQADGANLARTLASRRAAGVMLELIASAYSDAMHLAAGADLPAVHADQGHEIRTLADRFDAAGLGGILEQISRYEQLLRRNVNPRVVWDNAVITCATAAPLGELV